MRLQTRSRRVLATTLAAGLLATATGGVAVGTSVQAAQPAAAADHSGPQISLGSVIDVSDDVDGDVYAAGQTVTVSGDVTGDVIVAAQTVIITGAVEGDVRIAAQDVTIDGAVARSGTIVAATVTITDAGSFGDDLVGAASSIAIDGIVARDVLVSVETITIDGSVGRDLTYDSDTEASFPPGAVGGTVEHVDTSPAAGAEASQGQGIVGWLLGLLYALVALSIVAVVVALLLPRVLQRATDRIVPSPWKALLVGFVAAVAVPVATLLLAVTVIGAPLALAVSVVWLVLTLTTFVVGAATIGRLVLRGRQHPVLTTLLGAAILVVALHVPWLNVLVWVAMVLFGLGAQLLAIHDQRPWLRSAPSAPVTDDAPQPPAAAEPLDELVTAPA